ncbi:MAG: AMIN domain-containing protein, partial [Gemmatimonadetes bacterium]|nr:AMIN domain-containing protein [Gemmatimonadota bacterium]
MIHSRFVSFSVGATLLLSVSGATATTLGDAAVPAFAAPASVTSVGIVPGAARAEVVIGFVGDVSVVDFALDNGRRIVVDLTGATLGIPSRLYDKVQRAGIANIRFAQFKPEVVRVVVELDAPRAYTVVRGDSDVRLGVDGPTDFEPWQVAQQGGRPTVTAVAVKPTTAEKPASAPALPPRSANNNPRIETPVDPVMNPQGRQATAQPRMNVSFMDADIRDVVVQFADFSGKTIVVGPSVTGTVRASIVDQPWDIALKKILDGYGLAAIEDSTGIITVDSYRNLAALAAVEPLVSKIITVNYAKADAMAATVRSLLGAGCGGSAAAGAPPPDAAGGAAGGAAGEA